MFGYPENEVYIDKFQYRVSSVLKFILIFNFFPNYFYLKLWLLGLSSILPKNPSLAKLATCVTSCPRFVSRTLIISPVFRFTSPWIYINASMFSYNTFKNLVKNSLIAPPLEVRPIISHRILRVRITRPHLRVGTRITIIWMHSTKFS